MSLQTNNIYEFGEYRLDCVEKTLEGNKGFIPLTPKVFETLCVLVERAGHLIEKDELMQKLWQDRFVEESNLTFNIKMLRKALGDDAANPRFIETVQRRGYRFIADLQSVDSTGAGENRPPPTQYLGRNYKYRAVFAAGLVLAVLAAGYHFFSAKKRASGSDAKKSIAVLPVKPINSASRDEIYEVGIAESLIFKLGSMNGLVVRPLTATRKYLDIDQDPIAAGNEQHVDLVVASTYQLADGKIRVTTQLINVKTGQIEDSYKSEKSSGDVFAMQDAIAGEIANIFSTRFATASNSLVIRRGTRNEEAYRLYLQGRNLADNRNLTSSYTAPAIQKAVEYFEQAISLDPNFARAYAGMASALITSGNLGGDLPRSAYDKAKQAVNKALELESDLAEGYAVSGQLKYVCEWDFAGSEEDLLRSIELDPNSDLAHGQYAFFLAIRGHFDEAIAEAEVAQELDPSSIKYQKLTGDILFMARRYDAAIIQLERVIEVNGNFATAYGNLWLAYELKGDHAGAYKWFLKGQEQINSENIGSFQSTYEASGWPGVRQKLLELEKLNEQKPSSNYYRLARQSVMAGEKEQAFEYLNKAIEKRHGQLVMLNVEPSFDPLRGDVRFDELVRRVGLE